MRSPSYSSRLASAADEADVWLSDGRTYSAQRYSPLTQVTAENVNELGLHWYDDYDTFRGIEATPLYADGVLYNTLAWNITIAYDAATGERLWTFDPAELHARERSHVNRGVVYWEEGDDRRIFFTAGPHLYALDAETGRPIASFARGGWLDLREGLGVASGPGSARTGGRRRSGSRRSSWGSSPGSAARRGCRG